MVGRARFRNAPRTIDLDLVLFGDECVATPRLTVPHPRALIGISSLTPRQLDPSAAGRLGRTGVLWQLTSSDP